MGANTSIPLLGASAGDRDTLVSAIRDLDPDTAQDVLSQHADALKGVLDKASGSTALHLAVESRKTGILGLLLGTYIHDTGCVRCAGYLAADAFDRALGALRVSLESGIRCKI